MSIPRSEYPRPQFVRDDWLCLNGEWQFEIDPGDSGLERGLLERDLAGAIIVPFCPESTLSGIGNTDFMQRRLVPPRGARSRRRGPGSDVLLHFQAVDYDATVWVNGKEVARHRGGFTPLHLRPDRRRRAGRDASPSSSAPATTTASPQPRGKQSPRYDNYGCHYTRTTGIWQTVWLEPVPQAYLRPPAHHARRGQQHASAWSSLSAAAGPA